MPRMMGALAYQQAARHRSVRDQEADVFRRVNATLRAALDGDAGARSLAVADNNRLWLAVMDLLRDPANLLPDPLRASILSVGHAVRREMAEAKPDFQFAIGVNEQVAAGLAGG